MPALTLNSKLCVVLYPNFNIDQKLFCIPSPHLQKKIFAEKLCKTHYLPE